MTDPVNVPAQGIQYMFADAHFPGMTGDRNAGVLCGFNQRTVIFEITVVFKSGKIDSDCAFSEQFLCDSNRLQIFFPVECGIFAFVHHAVDDPDADRRVVTHSAGSTVNDRLQGFLLGEPLFHVLLGGEADLCIPESHVRKPANQVIGCFFKIFIELQDIAGKIKFRDALCMRFGIILKQHVVIIHEAGFRRNYAALQRFLVRPADIE